MTHARENLTEYVERVRVAHALLLDGLCKCGAPVCPKARLLAHIDDLKQGYVAKVDDLARETARNALLQARIDAVRAQHRRDDEDNCCVCWDVEGNFPLAWPCDTIHALDCPEPEADVRAAEQQRP